MKPFTIFIQPNFGIAGNSGSESCLVASAKSVLMGNKITVVVAGAKLGNGSEKPHSTE